MNAVVDAETLLRPGAQEVVMEKLGGASDGRAKSVAAKSEKGTRKK
jgi:hypothetical protein